MTKPVWNKNKFCWHAWKRYGWSLAESAIQCSKCAKYKSLDAGKIRGFFKKLKFDLVLTILFFPSMIYLGIILLCSFLDAKATREVMNIMLKSDLKND